MQFTAGSWFAVRADFPHRPASAYAGDFIEQPVARPPGATDAHDLSPAGAGAGPEGVWSVWAVLFGMRAR